MITRLLSSITAVSQQRFILMLITLSFCVRLGCMLVFGTPDKPVMYEFGDIAANMLSGHGFTMHWLSYIPLDPERRLMIESFIPPPYQTAWTPPLQTYIVYGAFLVWGKTSTAASMLMLLNVLWSTFIPLVVYRVANYISAERSEGLLEARCSALVSVFFLPSVIAVVTYSGSSLYQLLFLCIVGVIVFAIRKKKPYWFILAGFLSGLQMLLRSEFLLFSFVLFIALGILLTLVYQEKMWAVVSGFAIIVALLVITPWIWRNYQVFGEFVPIVSRPWFEIWRGNNPIASGCESTIDSTGQYRHIVLTDPEFAHLTRQIDSLPLNNRFEINANALHRAAALTFIRENPGATLWLSIKKVAFLWLHDLYNPQSSQPLYIFSMSLTFLLFGTGLFIYWRSSGQWMSIHGTILSLYCLYILYYTGIFAITFLLPRYRIYVFSGLLPFTGIGLVTILHWLQRLQRQKTE